MNKRGLSNVIVVLIMIVISLIAVGLVWGVAQQIISEGTEDISLAGFKINIKIIKAEIDGNNINVNTKRNVGSGNLTGIKFIFSDGENTEIKERTVSLKELESTIFTFTLNELNVLEVESVSIAPIYLSDSGKEILGNIADTFEFASSGSVGGICGNSIIETGEQCDDGNTNNGDGCSSTCQIEGESCTPAADPSLFGVCGTAECGTATNGTCENVICGTCLSGSCVSGLCVPETSINAGIVDLTWPPKMNLFFDSFNLSTTQSYTGNFVKFPGSLETRCLLIIDHIFPANPEDYNKSFIRLGTPNNEKSFVVSGDNYDMWASSSCGA